ncbi:permease-like cell division protein FtsX [Bifidobacterium vespertilionis]|uniref:Cell division protein FtsX n=1 Tax=Bifidobacterium vespertilionis TaxID=2562524 RepID=A0A5J5DZJ2_9BIFI|nr:permease-like cell division protein FtsX [Bifidobacterium vespertilionis]KAA8821959.1 FtsX-like permease family protein [Bifidobacterium vespertilionis]KAA8823250.1 FtsX-like permease family protein [Bifidobacterium vespertilionis]MBT1180187.1 FtsX-like permease family protein [Bifidobacterium vespertilionis]
MRTRFILSETWTSLKRNGSMILSVMLVTFISFLFIGSSALMQAQITKAKGTWYDQVEVVVYFCPDGTSQAASCASGKSPSQQEIADVIDLIHEELPNDVANITYVSKQDFYNDTFLKEYPNGEYNGRTLTAADMQDSLRLKLNDPTKYQVVSEVLSGRTGIEEVVDQRQIFDPIFKVLNRATAVTAALAVVMVVVAILLTGTTIRMSAASRRNETEIMRLVGASNWTIRLPFILEGMFAALLGSLLSVGALVGIVNTFITNWLAQTVSWMPFVNQTTVLLIAPALVAGALLLSALASAVSLRRYLKA